MLPDYRNNTVNLVSSVMKACGANSIYPPLRQLPPSELAGCKNIVLLVIDALGYDYVLKQKDSVLGRHLRSKITAVFPPTTAASITTFMTGVAPQNHGLTGWFVNLKEFGMVTAVLPFRPMYSGLQLNEVNPVALNVFNQKSIFGRLKTKSYVVQGIDTINSGYTTSHIDKAKKLSYTSMDGFFKQLKKVVRIKGRKLVYAYWPDFDESCHVYRKASKNTLKHFKELDKRMGSLLKSIKGTNTVLIVTADHGIIDTTMERTVLLKDHPVLQDCLTLPLCGEPRAAYCYVHPSKANEFLSYVRHNLRHACDVFKSEDLIKSNLFGLFKPHKQLFDRVGDYVLLMKKNYVVRQGLLGKTPHHHVGVHGGISPEEIFVPLIVIKA